MKKTTNTTTVRCDGEECIRAGVGQAFASLEVAKRDRWHLADDRDLCPKCSACSFTAVEGLRATFYRGERNVSDPREAHDAGLVAVATEAAERERERLLAAVQAVVDASIWEVNQQIDMPGMEGAAHPKAVGHKLGAEAAMQAMRTAIKEHLLLGLGR